MYWLLTCRRASYLFGWHCEVFCLLVYVYPLFWTLALCLHLLNRTNSLSFRCLLVRVRIIGVTLFLRVWIHPFRDWFWGRIFYHISGLLENGLRWFHTFGDAHRFVCLDNVFCCFCRILPPLSCRMPSSRSCIQVVLLTFLGHFSGSCWCWQVPILLLLFLLLFHSISKS